MLGVLQDRDHGCCFYDSNIGWAFGPVFRDLTEALEFEGWLRTYGIADAGVLDPHALETHWMAFCRRIPSGI